MYSIDIKEEPVHSNGLHGSENIEPPSESVTDQAIAATSSIHCSDDEATLSGSETDRKQPTIEIEDEDGKTNNAMHNLLVFLL